MRYTLLILMLGLLGDAFAHSAPPAKVPLKTSVTEWLVAGPFDLRVPVFSDTSHVNLEDLLQADAVNQASLHPREGQSFGIYPGQTLTWRKQTGEVNLPCSSAPYQEAYLATYIFLKGSRTVRLTIESDAATTVKAYLDGQPMEEKVTREGDGASLFIKREMHHGKHLLVVRSVRSPEVNPWKVKLFIAALPQPDSTVVSVSTDPRRGPANFSDITLFDNLGSPTLSPDGKWLAVVRSHRSMDHNSESWLEIYDAKSSDLARTLRPLKGVDNPFFFPGSDWLGFTATGDSGTNVWVLNMQSGEMAPAIKNIAGLQKLICSPDGQFLYFSADADKKIDADKPSLWTALENRMSDWTNTRKLYAVCLNSGATHEITSTGGFAIDEFALSREGDKLLFTRRIPETGRPYYSTEFWVYDIPSGKATLALAARIPWERRPLSLTWLPGGEKVLYSASRLMVAEGDTSKHGLAACSLWLLDLNAGTTTNLTQKENFSTSESEGRSAILWNEKEKDIWFEALVGGKVVMMRTDPLSAKPKFTEVSLKFPFVDQFDLSKNGSCAFIASDPVTPTALYLSGSADHAPKLVSNPAKEVLPSLELATFDRWNFTDSLGYSIDGWLYYPPNFSPQKKWPLVVYYYGGVSPRDERFTFTYHWWAANGYVVYVLNPVGSVGYGEAFANLHSDDWGTYATQDIIEGTRKLVSAKPFIDSTKMAAYGGSYGGFITMDLATKTEMFDALVSDAGISDIASYFGGGAWGFTYGDIALPNSFPWNRADVYAGKSPLYHADKIHTPLLLVHGLSDDNVPPIESAEMFTALKVLGRDVAFARYPNEDHSIAIKFSDLVDYRELMLAWFDKYLKHEPNGWNELSKKLGAE